MINKKDYTTEDLLAIIRRLREPDGCPWDKVQTHESIKKDMIEECYEAIDALDSGDDHAFANELGDVLLQVAFHSVLADARVRQGPCRERGGSVRDVGVKQEKGKGA